MLHRELEEAKLVASLKEYLKSLVLSSCCVECALKGSSRFDKSKLWQASFSNLYFFRCILALGSRLDTLFACGVVLAHGYTHWDFPPMCFAYLICVHVWKCTLRQ